MKILYTAAERRGALLHTDAICCGSGQNYALWNIRLWNIRLYAGQDGGVNARGAVVHPVTRNGASSAIRMRAEPALTRKPW